VSTPAEEIVCVECGGRAHLVQALDPEAPLEPGDVAVYRCSDCAERFDIVVEEEDVANDGG
jgi:predicted nucleic acid-binding Zn ribbon protein